MSRFDEQVVLVTGAGSGIGRAIARAFLAEGARVVATGRTAEKLVRALGDLDRTRWVAAAGRHEIAEATASWVDTAIERFGRLDVLVNNAGEYVEGSAAETTDAEWRRSLESNLTGPFTLTRAALPALRSSARAGRSPAIVNVASTLAVDPIPGALPYCVAKSGLVMLTRATALEEARAGVRVLCVAPGVVDTPIHAGRAAGTSAGEFLEQMAAAHPLGRVGRPEDIAELVLFLASSASSWTTGAMVPIDGGISLA